VYIKFYRIPQIGTEQCVLNNKRDFIYILILKLFKNYYSFNSLLKSKT